MPKKNPSSVTVEEAVARMVNMDRIPEGVTLSDMASFFLEEAEVKYHNARIDRLPEEALATLEARIDSCRARHSLVLQLLNSIKHEIESPEGSLIVVADDLAIKPRLTLESVAFWAAYEYGIDIPEWSQTGDAVTVTKSPSKAPWMIADPSDPPAVQPWYTPARYFARQLVRDDSTLLTKRDLLAIKVVASLQGVGIKKRGGKDPFDPGTIKKALVNVTLK